MRKEKDSMGEVSVPDDSYYGAQTQRAKEKRKYYKRKGIKYSEPQSTRYEASTKEKIEPTISGDVKSEEVIPLVDKYFGSIPRGAEVKKLRPMVPRLSSDILRSCRITQRI